MKTFAFLAMFFACANRNTTKAPRTRLRLEELEPRVVPAFDNFWVGPAGGLWSTASNWSLGTPNSQDILYLGSHWQGSNDNASVDDVSASVMAINAASGYGGITVNGGVTLTVGGGTGTWDSYGSVSLGMGSTLNGSITVEAGTLTTTDNMGSTITGSVLVNSNGNWVVTGFGMGTVNVGTSTGNGVTISGTLTIDTDGYLNVAAANTGVTIRHFSLNPTAHATFFLPLAFGCGAARGWADAASLAASPAWPACCQQRSSSNTTHRTTHFRLRHR